jgi:hypothetical protein
MRIAAGILMIMYGVKTIVLHVSSLFLDEWSFCGYSRDLFLVSIIAAVFFTTGGVFCLKRKYWEICFASCLCLLVFMFFDLLPTARVSLEFLNIPSWVVIRLLIPWAILPLIFVCIRKREWQEISA